MTTRARKRASSVAVIDIGSNSVRLVIYETMSRSLVTVFNEKALCGLGREVQTTGLLAEDAVNKALTELQAAGSMAGFAKAAGLTYLPPREPAILGDIWLKIFRK